MQDGLEMNVNHTDVQWELCVCSSIPDCQFVLQTQRWVGEKEALCEKKKLAPVEMHDEMAASYCGTTSTQCWEYFCFSLHKWVKSKEAWSPPKAR